MPLIVGGEEGEYLAAHEEEEPDAQLQQEARELGTLEVFMPLAGGADARPQLQEQDEHHRHGEYGPQSKHGADAAQHGRERGTLPDAHVFRRGKHAFHQSTHAVVTVRIQ